MPEHAHHWEHTNTTPAPEGINGRTIHLACACGVTRSTITLRTDDEIATELAGQG
jgi:hypothetical protein